MVPILVDKNNQPLKICVTKDVSSAYLTRKIQELGGIVTDNEKEASVLLAAPGRRYAVQMYSVDWVYDCALAQRRLPLDTEKYRLERSKRVFIKHFTKEDDDQLRAFIKRKQTESGRIFLNGNNIYKEMEKEHPQHPWHSWRERARNDLHLDQEVSAYELSKRKRQHAIDAQTARSAALQRQQQGDISAAPSTSNGRRINQHTEQREGEEYENTQDELQYQTQDPTDIFEMSQDVAREDEHLSPLTATAEARAEATFDEPRTDGASRRSSAGVPTMTNASSTAGRFSVRTLPSTFVRRAERLGAATSASAMAEASIEVESPEPRGQNHQRSQQAHVPPVRRSMQVDDIHSHSSGQQQSQSPGQGRSKGPAGASDGKEAWLHFVSRVQETPSQERANYSRRRDWENIPQAYLPWADSQEGSSSSYILEGSTVDYSNNLSGGSMRSSFRRGSRIYPAHQPDSFWDPSSLDPSPAERIGSRAGASERALSFDDRATEDVLTWFMDKERYFDPSRYPPLHGRNEFTENTRRQWNSFEEEDDDNMDSRRWSSASFRHYSIRRPWGEQPMEGVVRTRHARSQSPNTPVLNSSSGDSHKGRSSLASNSGAKSHTPSKAIPVLSFSITNNTPQSSSRAHFSIAEDHEEVEDEDEEDERDDRRWSSASFFRHNRAQHQNGVHSVASRPARSQSPQPTTRSQQQNTTARNAANDVPARLFATPVAPRSMRKDQASTRSHRSPLSRTPNNPITESTSRQQPQQHQQQQHDADNTEGGDVNEAPSTISSQHSSSLHPTSTKVIHATEEDGGVEIIRRVTRRETHEVVHVSTLRTTKPQSVGELKDTAHGTGEGKATSEQEEAAAGDEEEEDEPLVRYRPATHAAAAAVASADSTSHQTRSSPSKVPPEAVDEASPPAPTASGDTQMMEAEIQLSEMGILVDDDLEAHDRVIAESRNPHEEFYLKIEHGIESGSDDDDGIQAEKTPRTGTRPYGVHERLLDYLMYKYRNEIEALVKFELVTRYEALDILDACSGDIQLAKQYINGEVPDNKQGDIWTRDEDKVLMQMFEDDDQKELETLHSTVQCTKRSRYLTRTRMEAKLWKPKVHTRSLAADTVSRSAGANGKDVPSEHEG